MPRLALLLAAVVCLVPATGKTLAEIKAGARARRDRRQQPEIYEGLDALKARARSRQAGEEDAPHAAAAPAAASAATAVAGAGGGAAEGAGERAVGSTEGLFACNLVAFDTEKKPCGGSGSSIGGSPACFTIGACEGERVGSLRRWVLKLAHMGTRVTCRKVCYAY